MAGQVLVADLAARKTEDDVLEAAVREHTRLVYRVAYSVLRNHHDAEDATQETFVKVLKYRRKLSGVKDQRTWLARIAWRVAIDRKKKSPDLPLDGMDQTVLVSSLTIADESVLTSEMSALLERLIAGLPSQLQHALRLSTVEEMSNANIAEILDTSEASIRSRLFRARQLLKEKLSLVLGKNHGI